QARATRFAWSMPAENAWASEPLRMAARGRGAVRLVDCPHRLHARGHWGGHRNDPRPVVEALLERGFCVYGINPKQLDRFRDRFTVAGAKDDRRDAHVLADSLRTDRHAFRRLSNDEPVIVQLREWSRMVDELQQERARLASRMREQLWRYYLQMLELADDLAADWFLDLWNQAPSPTKAARLRQTTIERFVKAHRLRRWQAPEVLLGSTDFEKKRRSVPKSRRVSRPAGDHVVASRVRT